MPTVDATITVPIKITLPDPPAPPAPVGAQPLLFSTVDMVATLVTVTDGSTTNWQIVYSVNVGPLKAGDILSVACDGEVKNDNLFVTEMVSSIVLTPDAIPSSSDLNPGGYFIVPPNGENIDKATRHYARLTKAAHFRVPADMPVALVQCRIRARSSFPGTGNVLNIMGPGYGGLQVLRFPV